jgi:hypothetical protein
MRVVWARIFALLAALLMLLPGGAFARTQYYCAMTGSVMAARCCETDTASEAPSAAQELQVTDCCQRLSSGNRNASLGTREALHSVVTAALPAALSEAFPATPPSGTGSSCAESTQAPLAIGPPLFVAHCALLS